MLPSRRSAPPCGAQPTHQGQERATRGEGPAPAPGCVGEVGAGAAAAAHREERALAARPRRQPLATPLGGPALARRQVRPRKVPYILPHERTRPAARRRAEGGPHAPLVLANPDFDLGLDEAQPAPSEPTRARARAGCRGRWAWARCGACRARARRHGRSCPVWPTTPASPRACSPARARSAVFRKAKTPRVLVLCTHGFFLPDQQAPPRTGARRARRSPPSWGSRCCGAACCWRAATTRARPRAC